MNQQLYGYMIEVNKCLNQGNDKELVAAIIRL